VATVSGDRELWDLEHAWFGWRFRRVDADTIEALDGDKVIARGTALSIVRQLAERRPR
jgi:hypothetical protein